VIAFDSGVDSDIPATTVTTDNLAAAALAADKMAELIGGGGKVALVVHDQTSRTGIDRRDGFVNRMKEAHPDIEIVAIQYGARRPTAIDRDHQGNPDRQSRPEGHLRRQRGLGHRRGERRSRKPAPRASSSIGYDSGKVQKDAIREGRWRAPSPRTRSASAMRPSRPRSPRPRARNVPNHRHRFLLVRQDQHRRAGNRGGPLRLNLG
jgi:ribose transport system substrate-binding protein